MVVKTLSTATFVISIAVMLVAFALGALHTSTDEQPKPQQLIIHSTQLRAIEDMNRSVDLLASKLDKLEKKLPPTTRPYVTFIGHDTLFPKSKESTNR